jgi:hypothetical protein
MSGSGDEEEKREPEVRGWGEETNLLRGVSFRHKKLAHLVAIGWRDVDIAKELGFNQSRISVLKADPAIKALIEREFDRMHADSIEKSIKRLAPRAMENIEEILDADNEDKHIKVGQKAAMSQWVVEKLTGKPKQEVSVEGNLLGDLFDRLDQLSGPQGEKEVGATLELEESEPDKWESWLDNNTEE